jgi:hypothetical protein
MLIGLVKGMTAAFDTDCQTSLVGVIDGGFSALKYKKIYNPTNTIKF